MDQTTALVGIGAVALVCVYLHQSKPKHPGKEPSVKLKNNVAQGPPFYTGSVMRQYQTTAGWMPHAMMNPYKFSNGSTAKEITRLDALRRNAGSDNPEDKAKYVRERLVHAQKWEKRRHEKSGYKVIIPNNRKVVYVRGS
jgi:hypothetical protein